MIGIADPAWYGRRDCKFVFYGERILWYGAQYYFYASDYSGYWYINPYHEGSSQLIYMLRHLDGQIDALPEGDTHV